MDEDFRADAEVVLPCAVLQPTVDFFVERFGFAITRVFPADAPRVVTVRGYGLTVRFAQGLDAEPGRLRIPRLTTMGLDSSALVAPNGTIIEFFDPEASLERAPLNPARVFARADGAWVTGRAGMLYRDLVPDRLGGRFIISHIRIPDGGPVPDWVHFHRVDVQLLFCLRGWVRVVYEGQGPSFVMNAGDCVLQPPEIRHRVLEASPGFEVVELGSPAEHETLTDHAMELPGDRSPIERRWSGQRFCFHRASEASWIPWVRPGFAWRDTGISAATGGLATAGVVRVAPSANEGVPEPVAHGGDLGFGHVLSGTVTLRSEGHPDERLSAGDSWCVPGSEKHRLVDHSADLEFLWLGVRAGG